jgi:hypothetical protein
VGTQPRNSLAGLRHQRRDLADRTGEGLRDCAERIANDGDLLAEGLQRQLDLRPRGLEPALQPLQVAVLAIGPVADADLLCELGAK